MEFTGFTPHTKQKEMINAILDSKSKFHVACVGRQFGKSLMAMNLVLYWGINKGPAKSYGLVRYTVKQIKYRKN